MREIKFRGKRVDNGEWEYGTPIITEYDDIKDACIMRDWDHNPTTGFGKRHMYFVPVIPETVGQFTGLKLKGIEVYDGDILGQDCAMVDDYTGKSSVQVQKLIVRWDEEKLTWSVYAPDAPIRNNWGYIPKGAYVIGSIHDKH